MSDTPNTPPDDGFPDLNRDVKEQLLDREMKESYLSYAMSVIIQRALPDVRDGLKPSQRRILVAMNDLNLGPRSKYRKCAKIVGDTTGNYHPHGDQAVYPTLVRLAQPFNMRYQLIDPQGNFGYVDGSPPAAMRYTEARMRQPSMDMLDDLSRGTVDFVPNYDDTRSEPSVLPSRFPNLLCNGSQGIAVGMATSIPPHNLTEIADGLIHLIRNPEAGLDAIMEFVKGPDFPTGGIICGRAGILKAFRTGRGLITVRGRVHMEERRGGRETIVITQLPYQVNPNSIFDRLKDLMSDGVVSGITNVNDETDRRAGLRLVLDLKKGENAELIVNQLYKLTPLQSTFSIIMLALDKGRPRTFGLVDMLAAFRDHRVEVIQRRTRYLLHRAQERCHIVEGLRKAVQNIDEVVRIIKESASQDVARTSLVATFALSKRQADAILALRLGRLTGLEVTKLEEEYQKLLDDIRRFEEILGDVTIVHEMIISDLEEVRARYGDDRRTDIEVDINVDIEDESLIPVEDIAVTVTHSGYIKRTLMLDYRSQGRGGKGVTGADLKEGDFVERLIVSSTHSHFLFLTNKGRVFSLKGYQIPELSRTSRGRAMVNLLSLLEGESVTSILTTDQFDDGYLVLLTKRGIIKKSELSAYSRIRQTGLIACNLDEGDSLVRALLTTGEDELMVCTAKGQSIRFLESNVRCMGRVSRGVKAVRLKPEDHVVGMVVVNDDTTLLSICEYGYGKRSDFSAYRRQGRGGSGIRNILTSERNGEVVAVLAVTEEDGLMLISERGMIVRTEAGQVSLIGRGTQGVRVMGLKKGDRVVACATVAAGEDVLPDVPPDSDKS